MPRRNANTLPKPRRKAKRVTRSNRSTRRLIRLLSELETSSATDPRPISSAGPPVSPGRD